MNEDAALLQRFVAERSDAAFRELVERRIDFVYAAALRQVRGDARLAEEVAQNVFIDLARKARVLATRPNLSGWLYTSTRFAAAKALRSRVRRINHETEAHVMQEILEAKSSTEINWNELRPVIDVALHELGEKDRDAILLRFFEGRSLAEVGAAIGLAENTARMRVERALEKLRARLASRGITSTAAALATALAAQPTIAAPAGLAASVAGAGLVAAAMGSGGMATMAGLMNFMSSSKLALGVAGAIAAIGLGAFFGATYPSRSRAAARTSSLTADAEIAALRAENRRLQAELARARAPRTEATKAQAVETAAERAPSDYSALRVLLELRRRKLGNVEFEFFGDGAGLEPAFMELFGISGTERGALQAAIDTARRKIDALTRENMNVSRTANGGVAIAIRPFPEAGGAVYDAMLKTFADTLGSERYTAFLALGAEQVEKKLGRFGTTERTILLSRDTTGGEVTYRIDDHSHWSDHDNSNYTSLPMSAEQLAREMGVLAEALPPDFVPHR